MKNISLAHFYDLKEKEKIEILNWRNNFNVRKWMHNTNIISKNDHLAFINSLKENKNKIYFLVKEEKEKIGVINFVKMSTYTEFGIYSNPNLKGYGNTLMHAICNYGFKNLKLKKLVAEVFSENKKAISLYNRFNFKEFNRCNFEGREIIFMELKK